MRIAIFTQDDPLFIRHALGPLLVRHADRTVALYLSGTGKRKQGRIAELFRYLRLFGLWDFSILVRRVLEAKWISFWHRRSGMFYPVTPRDLGDYFGLPVRYVKDYTTDELVEELRKDSVDLVVSVSYNWIFSQKLIDAVPLGIINTHNAPLPNYRGLMPAFWQLLHNESESAATVHRVVKEIDAGEVLGSAPVPVEKDDTWERLLIRSKKTSGELLSDVVDRIAEAAAENRTPPGEILNLKEGSYFSFPTAAEGRAFRKTRRFWGK